MCSTSPTHPVCLEQRKLSGQGRGENPQQNVLSWYRQSFFGTRQCLRSTALFPCKIVLLIAWLSVGILDHYHKCLSLKIDSMTLLYLSDCVIMHCVNNRKHPLKMRNTYTLDVKSRIHRAFEEMELTKQSC